MLPLQEVLTTPSFPILKVAIIEREEKKKIVKCPKQKEVLENEISQIRLRIGSSGVHYWVAPILK